MTLLLKRRDKPSTLHGLKTQVDDHHLKVNLFVVGYEVIQDSGGVTPLMLHLHTRWN
jgi:hypothetical protein